MDTSPYVLPLFILSLIGSLQLTAAPLPISVQVQGTGDFQQGQPFNLTCVSTPAPSSDTSPVYIWFKNGEVLRNRTEKALTFHKLSKENEGAYQCNQAGMGRAHLSELFQLRVIVPGDRPTVVVQGQMVTGADLLISCIDPVFSTLSPSDDVLYLWYRNSVFIRTEHSRDMTLSNVSFADDGDYSCQIKEMKSREETPVSNGARVFINTVPIVYIEQATGELYKVTEGENLSLTCIVSNNPKPIVVASGYSWTVRHMNWTGNVSDTSTKEVNLTDPNQSWYISAHRTDNQLTIISADRSHSGLYTCHASNDPENKLTVKPATASIEVQVQYLDNTVTVEPPTKEILVVKDKITLTCRADSLPTATLTWLYQGHVLHTTKGDSDVFTFTATSCQDSGDYQCRADNENINKSAFGITKLNVECPPSPSGNHNVWEPIEVAGILGKELILSVPANGTPPLLYTWTGPGVLPAQSRAHSVRLFPLRRSHAGFYSVSVTNKHGYFSQNLRVVVQEEGGDPASGGGTALWLQVGGGVAALVFFMTLLGVLLSRGLRRRRLSNSARSKDGGLRRRRLSNSARSKDGHQSIQLHSRDRYDSTRGQQGRDVVDYSSEESTGHYWSIDSSNLPRRSQTFQSQDSLSQGEDVRVVDYDVPSSRAELPSSRVQAVRDHKSTSVITGHDDSEGFADNDDLTATRRSGPLSGESDSESEDSEGYLVCEVVSPGLPPSSLASQGSDPLSLCGRTLYLDMGGTSQ